MKIITSHVGNANYRTRKRKCCQIDVGIAKSRFQIKMYVARNAETPSINALKPSKGRTIAYEPVRVAEH
jgi:hypothetical protein